jgi:hypothetical protein
MPQSSTFLRLSISQRPKLFSYWLSGPDPANIPTSCPSHRHLCKTDIVQSRFDGILATDLDGPSVDAWAADVYLARDLRIYDSVIARQPAPFFLRALYFHCISRPVSRVLKTLLSPTDSFNSHRPSAISRSSSRRIPSSTVHHLPTFVSLSSLFCKLSCHVLSGCGALCGLPMSLSPTLHRSVPVCWSPEPFHPGKDSLCWLRLS